MPPLKNAEILTATPRIKSAPTPTSNQGKIYPAMESMYSNINEYFVSDDSLKQHWYSKSFFREATEEEVGKFLNY